MYCMLLQVKTTAIVICSSMYLHDECIVLYILKYIEIRTFKDYIHELLLNQSMNQLGFIQGSGMVHCKNKQTDNK